MKITLGVLNSIPHNPKLNFLIIMNKNIIYRNFILTADSYYFLNLETKINSNKHF